MSAGAHPSPPQHAFKRQGCGQRGFAVGVEYQVTASQQLEGKGQGRGERAAGAATGVFSQRSGRSGIGASAFRPASCRRGSRAKVSGRTGSGKTTTLYSVLKQLASRTEYRHHRRSIEMVHEGCPTRLPCDLCRPDVQQRPANGAPPDRHHHGRRNHGRPPDTVRAASRTLVPRRSTHDAPFGDAAADLGIPHFLILSTVIGIVAQRLVRGTAPTTSECAPTLKRRPRWASPADRRRTIRRGSDACTAGGRRVGRDGCFR